MANSMTADVHKATTWSIGLSVLMIVAGLLAIVAPLVAGVAVISSPVKSLARCPASRMTAATRST